MNSRTARILHAAMWIGVIAVAFVFQVIPLLLVLTLLGMALGFPSPVAIVALPLALFGAVVLLCVRAEKRRGARRPMPFRSDEQRLPLLPMEHDNGLRLTEMRRRWLY
ncbi:MAG: hypothetical protein WD767_19060 [Alphaproteobacteria bacterium]